MRVLIFSPQFEKGAFELLQKDLACSLNKFGVKVYTLNTHKSLVKNNSFNSSLIQNGVTKVFFIDLATNPNLFQLLVGVFKLRLLLKKEKIDIIETSSESLSIFTILSCLGTKIYHVVGIHKIYNKKYLKNNYFKELFFLLLTKLRSRIYFYAVSNFSKKSWVNFSKTNNKKVKVIYNSIKPRKNKQDKKQFKKQFFREFKIPINTKLILSAGRICFHKRQDFIIESLSPILIERNINLLFIGEYDLGTQESLETKNRINLLIKKYNLQSKIKFCGFREDIKEIMSIADVFVHSTLTESFGLVLLEAMSEGLPIVSTNVDAIPEIVSEPDNYLVDINESEAFRNCVLSALNRNNKYYLEVSKRNKNIAKDKKYSSNQRTKEMFKYFQRILDT